MKQGDFDRSSQVERNKAEFLPHILSRKKREWARKEKEEAKVEKARKKFQMFILEIGWFFFFLDK